METLVSINIVAQKQEKPNFLFLVIEDTSPYLLPVYGNKTIKTPNIDYLAENGVVFTKAYSNAPQCSPARSSLISGSYSTTYGTDVHRNPYVVPKQYFFPQYLRENGYFTVNAGKKDYNATKALRQKYLPEVWDRDSWYATRMGRPNASYNDKERGDKPFYAQFNNNTTHMSRMTTVSVNNRKNTKLNLDSISLPPHVPDLFEVRSDYALHLEGVRDADKWVGIFLDDLKERNLLENTIVFFFSDHGGSLPRGKAFGYNTGYQVALVVYAPPKWQHLLPSLPGTRSDRLVQFTDFGPTLLSVAGAKPPDHMQGKPFMGEFEAKEREFSYNFRTNTGYHFDPSRTVYNKQFQYIKFYTPYKKHALRQNFQWGMPAQLAWDRHFLAGKCLPQHRSYYEEKPREMLFDIENDPFCLNNLADNPDYNDELESLQKQVSFHIRESQDVGFFPRDVRDNFSKEDISLYNWVRETKYPLDFLHDLVEKASSPTIDDVETFSRLLEHDRPEIRFWAASGLAYLFEQGHYSKVPRLGLRKTLKDDFPSIASTAALALVYAGEVNEGIRALLNQGKENNRYAWSAIENIGSLLMPYIEEIRSVAESTDNKSTRMSAHSILINFGEMDVSEYYDKSAVEKYLENHRDRVKNWAPTRP